MGRPIPGDDKWRDQFVIPDDGDPPTAAACNIGLSALADRTRYLWVRRNELLELLKSEEGSKLIGSAIIPRRYGDIAAGTVYEQLGFVYEKLFEYQLLLNHEGTDHVGGRALVYKDHTLHAGLVAEQLLELLEYADFIQELVSALEKKQGGDITALTGRVSALETWRATIGDRDRPNGVAPVDANASLPFRNNSICEVGFVSEEGDHLRTNAAHAVLVSLMLIDGMNVKPLRITDGQHVPLLVTRYAINMATPGGMNRDQMVLLYTYSGAIYAQYEIIMAHDVDSEFTAVPVGRPLSAWRIVSSKNCSIRALPGGAIGEGVGYGC